LTAELRDVVKLFHFVAGSRYWRSTVNNSLRDNYPWLAELEARERAIAIVQTEAAYAAGYLRNLANYLENENLDAPAVDCKAVGERLEAAIAKAMERGK
jgi:hypothetical protein